MKAPAFLFFYLLLNGLGAQDQYQVFSLKPALGLNGCQIHGDSYAGYDKLGLFGGFAMNANFNTKSSLDIGFYFSQKGSRHNPNPKRGDYTYYRANLNYLDIPLIFHYKVNTIYYITLGPSFAYLLSAKEEASGNIGVDGKFNRFELGLNCGLSRKLVEQFYIEVRFSNSITPIRNYGIKSTIYYPNPVARYFNKGLYNNIITLLVIYKIELKHKRGN